jgi:hypothetical protein
MAMQKNPSCAKKVVASVGASWNELVSAARVNQVFRQWHHPRGGPKPKLSGNELMKSLVCHAMQGCGTLGEHVEQATGQRVSDGALSARRQGLPWEIFERLLALALRPRAEAGQHPGAFYRGLRLVGADGSRFSVSNTPQILNRLSKMATRRMRAAFAKVGVAVLMELGLHNPVAVAIGREGESEMSLAKRLLGSLQKGWLLLADRYYGVGVFVGALLELKAQRGCEFLVRVKERLKRQVIEGLPDGSLLVEVKVAKGRRALVREIRGRVRRRHGGWITVRLWTSLLEAARYPALELLALYAQRWEIEVGYKELKVELRGGALLSSHTVETAAQELAALVLAQAVLVQVRLAAGAQAGVEVLRISFVKVLHWVRTFWLWASVGADLLTERQLATCVRRLFTQLTHAVSRPRRARSCPRAVRQPIRGWPRLIRNTQEIGQFHYELLPVKS